MRNGTLASTGIAIFAILICTLGGMLILALLLSQTSSAKTRFNEQVRPKLDMACKAVSGMPLLSIDHFPDNQNLWHLTCGTTEHHTAIAIGVKV